MNYETARLGPICSYGKCGGSGLVRWGGWWVDGWMGKDCHTVDCKINTRAQHTHSSHCSLTLNTRPKLSLCTGGRKEIDNKSRRGEKRTRGREFPGARKTGGGQAIRAAFHEPHPSTIHHPSPSLSSSRRILPFRPTQASCTPSPQPLRWDLLGREYFE